MRRIYTIVAVLALFAVRSYAQDELAVGCRGPDTSSMFEACVLEKKRLASEKKLGDLYRERLRAARSPAILASLRESQKAWKQHRDKTCTYEQAEYGGINSVNFVRCAERMTAERVRYLEELR